MSASSETSCVTPEVLLLRPIVTVADCGGNPSSSKDGECHTPTSKESKLPSVPENCPPAPRKPRRVVSCKRALQDLEVIMVGAEELERLFRRREEPTVIALRGYAKRRRCHRPGDK